MALQKSPLFFNIENMYIFKNNKDFLGQSEGNGIKCSFCDSKIFYGYSNWKGHCKGKKHMEKTINITEINPQEKEILKLKAEIKDLKIMVTQESNKCQVLKNSLLEMKKKLNEKIKLE